MGISTGLVLEPIMNAEAMGNLHHRLDWSDYTRHDSESNFRRKGQNGLISVLIAMLTLALTLLCYSRIIRFPDKLFLGPSTL